MSKIERFECIAVHNHPGYTTAAMRPSERGEYVTYASHAEKVNALQSRLDTLELMQKQDFFYHLQKGLGKVAEQAINDVVSELVKKSTQTVFKANPCENLTEQMVSELCDNLKKCGFESRSMVIAIDDEPDPMACSSGWFIGDIGTMSIGDAYIKSGIIKNGISDNPANTASEYKLTLGVNVEQKPFTLKCIKSNVDCFTQGRSYDYEIRADVFYITSDDFVSDLKEGDHWKTEDMGAYMAVLHSTSGEPIVMFKKAYA